jgi:2-polyprenyl-3-methyl-5-hydroxy-6-metoxy-1,4-benzoquinol methylase
MNPQNVSNWTRGSLQSALDAVVARVGPWTSHSIDLGQGVHTRAPEINWRVEAFTRIMHDFGFSQLRGVRILDLACLEGLFAIEFARQGAITIGIEGRQANVDKAVFARDVLGLRECQILRNDVRNLRALELGQFDVVLCAGILYHLDAADAIDLIGQIALSCKKLAIFDTHIAPDTLVTNPFSLTNPMSQDTINGQSYEGRYYREHASGEMPQQKEAKLWASLDNEQSFWLSKPSLYRALQVNGFSGIYDAFRDITRSVAEIDRVIFAALK